MQRIPTFRIIGLVFLILFSIIPSYSQDTDEPIMNPVDQILSHTENVYQADDRLINGTFYIPKHPLAIGHPYYLTTDWLQAILYIKGLTYKDVSIRFNIEEDLVVLKRQYELGLVEEILLNTLLIDSLRINDNLFINSPLMNIPGSPGFLEVIYNGKYESFLKYKKEHKDELTHTVRYGKYLDTKRVLYLFDGKDFIKINDKQDLYDIFAPHEKEIKKFMRKNKIHLKNSSKEQYVQLLKYCDGL